MLWNAIPGEFWFITSSKIKESHDIRDLETMSVPLGRQLGNATCSLSVRVMCLSHSSEEAVLWTDVFTSMVERFLDRSLTHRFHNGERRGWNQLWPQMEYKSPLFPCINELVGCEQIYAIHILFGDELRYVFQPWDDVSGVILCVPVSQKNTYMPVALEVSVVGMKWPLAIPGSPITCGKFW